MYQLTSFQSEFNPRVYPSLSCLLRSKKLSVFLVCEKITWKEQSYRPISIYSTTHSMKRLVRKIRIHEKKNTLASPGQPHSCKYRALSYFASGQKRTDRSFYPLIAYSSHETNEKRFILCRKVTRDGKLKSSEMMVERKWLNSEKNIFQFIPCREHPIEYPFLFDGIWRVVFNSVGIFPPLCEVTTNLRSVSRQNIKIAALFYKALTFSPIMRGFTLRVE